MRPLQRVPQIDVLRAIAILLVLLQHFGPNELWIHQFGWTGVDLFFVLSGFLVSGLLFREMDRFGDVEPKRFLIRRGYKIYPTFWIMITATIVLRLCYREHMQWRQIADELLFLQNYGPSLWSPTWSLAVEEHFYLLLALGFYWWGRKQPAISERRGLLLAGAFLLLILAVRTATVLTVTSGARWVTWGTHVRLDSLAFGTILAYLNHRHRNGLRAFVQRHWLWMLPVGIAMVCHVFVWDMGTVFTRTIGYTLLYLGYSAIMLTTLFMLPATDAVSRFLAAIGRNSYGIYIWHMPFFTLVVDKLVGWHVLPKPLTRTLPFYLVVCIGAGILLTRLIEAPFLVKRDRDYPNRKLPPVVVPVEAERTRQAAAV
jgi:peptidoglycan/LPS O-acetylase OafA/YrhL